MAVLHASQPRAPWNKGKLIGQKAPLKLKDIWARSGHLVSLVSWRKSFSIPSGWAGTCPGASLAR